MRWKQLATVMMGTVLVFGSLPFSVSAKAKDDADTQKGKYETKDESIYGNLGLNGTLEDMYVINTFHVKKPGTIKDHGDYTKVRNLSNLSDMKQNDDDVRFKADKKDEDFYYQGYLENQPLPWDIDITYLLDGEKVDPDELAGKDGPLEIQIKTSANKDVDKTFFENYMMQISLTLDPSSFDNIQAPDGTKAKEGKDTNVTFTAMPDDEQEFVVSADVTDLEMDPINISASPASMPIDDPDLGGMKGDMRSLADGIKEINGGVHDLKGGISDLNNGAWDLNNGSSSYLNGINELDQSSGELVDGSSQMNDVFQEVNNAMQAAPDEAPDMSDLRQLPGSIRTLADGLDETADEIDGLRDQYDTAHTNLSEAIDGISDQEITDDEINELLDSDVDEDVVQRLVDSYHSAQAAKDTYADAEETFAGVTETLDDSSASMRDMADEANSSAADIENGLAKADGLDELDDLQSGVADLASQYQSFHEGLVDYTDGVSDLASNYQAIDEGIGDLANGTDSLKNGVGDLQEGTEDLEDKTSDMPGEMQSEVDDMMDEYDASDFEPKSFVSDQNKDIDVVQFALKTKPIEVEEPETKEHTDKDEEKNLWQRFLDLF